VSALPEPYWQDEARGLRLFHGDCRAILPCFADGEFGSVVTDPPYGVGIADWDIPPDSAILQECLRVATGTVVMFGRTVDEALKAFCHLTPEADRLMVWAADAAVARYRPAGIYTNFQAIWVWRPPKKADGIASDVLRHRTRPIKNGGRSPWLHKCWKPESLMADLCIAFGGTSVLDPYCGSGTTLAACAKLGLPCAGVELEEKYCAMTVARLTEDLTYGEPNLFNQGPADVPRPAP